MEVEKIIIRNRIHFIINYMESLDDSNGWHLRKECRETVVIPFQREPKRVKFTTERTSFLCTHYKGPIV